MSKLYQITDEDLAALEREIPLIVDVLMDRVDTRLRMKIRIVKDILSNVRWDYHPHSNVTIIPADGPVDGGLLDEK